MTDDGRAAAPAGVVPPGERPRLDQPIDTASLYALRATVEAHAAEAGLPEGRAGDLVLTVYELATNAIRHGAGSGRLRMWVREDALVCRVTDDGPGDGAGRSEVWPSEHGHGLWIVRFTADEFTVSSGPGGTAATAVFLLPLPDRPPFGLDRRTEGDTVVLAVTGDLDQANGPEIGAAVDALVAADPAARIVLDLAGMTSWDSIGVAALISAQQRVAADGGALVLAGLPPGFGRRLDALGFVSFTYGDDAAP